MSANLYRLFDQKHQLLYVGISASAIARLSQHMSEKPWAGEVAHVAVEHYETRQEAAAAERQANVEERPRYNVTHRRVDPETLPARALPRGVMWVCRGCQGPVADGDGYLHVSYKAIHEAETARRDWYARHGDANGMVTLTGPDLFSFPDQAPWVAHHSHCDPEPEAGDYFIDVERARTAEQLLSWTAHLMGKDWLSATDWQDVLERVKRDLRVVA